MSRDDGFPVMDISTSIVHDPKFRQLHRERPEHVAAAFMAYVAVLGESWKAGRRVSVTVAWPPLLPFDQEVVNSMIRVRLVERGGLPPRKAWDGWYRPAFERRAKARDRWRRYNANRDADTAFGPRGSDVDTATSVPSVRSFLPSGPPVPSTARGKHGSKSKEERRGGPPESLGDIMAKAAIKAADQEREANRLEALALHERYKRGDISPSEYERLRADLGKQPDDLTRAGA